MEKNMRTLVKAFAVLAVASSVSACDTWHRMWDGDDHRTPTASSGQSTNARSEMGVRNNGAYGDQYGMKENYAGYAYRSPKNKHRER